MSFRDSTLAIFVMFLWGAQVTAVKIAGAEVPPFLMLAIRFTAIALIIIPFVKHMNYSTGKKVAAISLFTCIFHFGFLYLGIALVKASTSAILYQSTSLFIVFLAAFFLHEKFTLTRGVGLGIAMAGIVLLFGGLDFSEDVTGAVFVLLASMSFAIGTTLTKKLGPIDPLALNGWSAAMAAPLMLAVSLSIEPLDWGQIQSVSIKGWLAVGYTALSGGVIGFALWYRLVNRNQVSKLAPYSLLTPLFAVGVSETLLQEGLSRDFLISSALVLLGVIVAQFGIPRFLIRLFSQKNVDETSNAS